MKSFEIEDAKQFMNELLVAEKYDSFYMYELRLRTGLDYYINGKNNIEFYDTEEVGTLNDYVSWGTIKKTVFDLIKGKRLPISFKLILMFNRENIERLVEMNNLPFKLEDIGALFFNVYYEKGELTVTTGTSIKTFSLDKSLDNIWDEAVEKYYI